MWYFIRFSCDNATKEELATLLGTPYLISSEYSKRDRFHYHIVHQSLLTKDELKDKIYKAYPYVRKGNMTLNVKYVGPTLHDWKLVSTYSVKDGDFIHSAEFDDYISQFVENSFQKEVCYKEELAKLIEETTDDDYFRINFQKLKRDIAILRARHGLEVYKSKIEAKVLSIRIDLNHNVADDLFPDED